jgi:hypothetical protein
MQNNVLCDRPELKAFFKVLTTEEHHCHEYIYTTYLKKYTQHTKSIRVANCLTKVSVLAAVPIDQMKLQPKLD